MGRRPFWLVWREESLPLGEIKTLFLCPPPCNLDIALTKLSQLTSKFVISFHKLYPYDRFLNILNISKLCELCSALSRDAGTNLKIII